MKWSSVALSILLNFFLLLESITALHVTFLTVDDLISETFSNGFIVLESSLPSSTCQKIDSLIDSSNGGNIHSLFSHSTSTTDSSGIFSRASNLDGRYENLNGVSASQQVNDFESMSNNSDSFDFLACISAMELHGSNQSLNNRTQSFSKLLSLISSSSMRYINLRSSCLNSNIVNKTRIFNYNIFIWPSWE